jgi:hypothetical protein
MKFTPSGTFFVPDRCTLISPTPLPQPHPQPLLPTLPTLLQPRRRFPAPVPPYPPRRPHRPPLHHRPRWNHRPAHRRLHPRRPLDTQPHKRPVRSRAAQSPTLREGRLAARRPQRPLCAHLLAAYLLTQSPLRQPHLAPLRNTGLDCQPVAHTRVARRGRARRATAAVRGRRAG